MKSLTRQIGTFLIWSLICGCSYKVSAKNVYGTYVASYPFGTDTITLNRDGTFVQRVVIEREAPKIFKGHWSFDQALSYARFQSMLIVDDGNGHLNGKWQIPSSTLVDLDVEMHWTKIVMDSAADHPYMKQ